MKGKIFALFALLGSLSTLALAGPSNVKWTASLQPPDARAGESAQIVLTAKIASGWHLYKIGETGGPFPTSFDLGKSTALATNGAPIEPAPKTIFDPNFKANLGEYETAVAFAVPVKIAAGLSGPQKAVVTTQDQTCNAHVCTIPETVPVTVAFTVGSGPARPDHTAPVTSVPAQPVGYSGGGAVPAPAATAASSGSSNSASDNVKDAEKKGLLAFIMFAFAGGLVALATPCVFPMIPITVSYFAKKSGGEKKNFAGAFVFCGGIIGTYTILGLLFTVIFGASGINNLAANPWINLILATLFFVLALSLFGLFEIRLPSAMLNKANAGTRKGGLAGPFFMGLTFTLTSFTCTAPLVGALLGQAATGQYAYPLLGLFFFGLAFSLPFFLLALFPQFLADLPKSGSWLNTVKGFMGFVEIAAGVKFLSNADLVWQLGYLTRPIFLAIWAMVGIITALYLFGLMKLSTDGGKEKIGFMRVAIGVVTLAATGLFLSGVGGNTKGFHSFLLAWLPPVPYPGQQAAGPQEIQWLGKYQQAVTAAEKTNKPIFIDFTGVTCTNCRAMEEQMFPRPEVRKLIDGYVDVQLYTDRPTPDDRFNAGLEQKFASETTLPMYVIVTPEGKVLKAFSGYTEDAKAFVSFLQAGQTSKVAER
ncbi:MAG TPA: cytochrome c biogenesis protein CcdA [Fimbriimonadaceae bacterium]